jgi:hypothetical protein
VGRLGENLGYVKKLIAVLAAALMALPILPAQAGKAKHVTGSIEATLLPFPNYSSHTQTAKPGCTAGEQDVHWAAQEFTAPGKGTLRFYAEGFSGDWDLYVFDGDLKVAESVGAQVDPAMAPAEEEISISLKKKQTVTLVVCNWLGDPNVVAAYEGHFK